MEAPNQESFVNCSHVGAVRACSSKHSRIPRSRNTVECHRGIPFLRLRFSTHGISSEFECVFRIEFRDRSVIPHAFLIPNFKTFMRTSVTSARFPRARMMMMNVRMQFVKKLKFAKTEIDLRYNAKRAYARHKHSQFTPRTRSHSPHRATIAQHDEIKQTKQMK